MKNKSINLQNNRFFKVQEELKNFFSIITGVILKEAENEQNFEYFEQIATSKDDIKTIEELKKSIEKLSKEATNYRNNIGINTSKQHRKTTNSQEINSTINTTTQSATKYFSDSDIDKKIINIDKKIINDCEPER